MAQTVVILIHVLFGVILGFVGLIVFGQGAIMIANESFPTWSLVLTMLAGLSIGSGLMFGAWRLLSSTLRLQKPAVS